MIGLDHSHDVRGSLRSALECLHRAFIYARETNFSRWQFAVEIEELWKLGLSNTELRWLIARELFCTLVRLNLPPLTRDNS